MTLSEPTVRDVSDEIKKTLKETQERSVFMKNRVTVLQQSLGIAGMPADTVLYPANT